MHVALHNRSVYNSLYVTRRFSFQQGSIVFYLARSPEQFYTCIGKIMPLVTFHFCLHSLIITLILYYIITR